MRSEVMDLEEGEEVGCFFCMKDWKTQGKSFKKGEAFLCGPDHSPNDGSANYVCKEHLDTDAILPNGEPAHAW